MKSTARYLSYASTGMFSGLIVDYLAQDKSLQSFYQYTPDIDGIKKAILQRKSSPINRELIQQVFAGAYAHPSDLQSNNIKLLSEGNTFTITTAHQPNIFTGYLYFIYKTAHVIALSRQLKKELPEYNFVPVFYIGSEDNDLDELSKFKLNGKSFQWHTNQTGAVGRMKVEKQVFDLIDSISSEIGHFPHGAELIDLLRRSYSLDRDITEGTFILLNELFAEEGLLVLQPDRSDLKSQFKSVMRDDLLSNSAEKIVEATNQKLQNKYKLQVNPRNVNLFYLRDGIRNRIDKRGTQYTVDGTVIRFTEEEILKELDEFPERFSPNVILRGLYQETILPNIIFVGGGSEVAYWMQLKDLFQYYKVPYPVLVLRNSFTITHENQEHKMRELGITDLDLFKEETELANEMVKRWAGDDFTLAKEEKESKDLFAQLKKRAGEVDKTLIQHVHALEVFHLKKLESLEKKMLKAERKKQSVELQRIWKLKSELFPNHSLQERTENFMPYYAQYGPTFIKTILQRSLSLEMKFGVIIFQ